MICAWMRFSADGARYQLFGNGGKAAFGSRAGNGYDYAYAMALQPDGGVAQQLLHAGSDGYTSV